MSLVFFVLTVMVTALLFAKMEIQIEGPNGWAKNLPTWRMENGWTKFFLGDKPLTGYHLYLKLFLISMAHAPFGLGLVAFSLGLDLRIWAFIFFLEQTEDLLWFVLNPAYGFKKFRKEFIWWHDKKWWWIAPRDYFVFFTLGALCYWLSTWVNHFADLVRWW